MNIEKDKTYVTRRDKYPVRIYATDGGGDYPVHGAYLDGGTWWYITRRKDGTAYGVGEPSPSDFVEVKPEHTVWLNIYRSGTTMHFTPQMADACSSSNRIACVPVTYREGDGL